MENKTLYEILGITKSATADEVKQAYRSKSKEYHPDKNQDNVKEANDKFIEVKQAYEILIDPVRRQKYDTTGTMDVLNTDMEIMAYIQNIVIPTILRIQKTYFEKTDMVVVIRDSINHLIEQAEEQIRNKKEELKRLETFLQRLKQDPEKKTRTTIFFQPKIQECNIFIQNMKSQIEVSNLVQELFDGAEWMGDREWMQSVFGNAQLENKKA